VNRLRASHALQTNRRLNHEAFRNYWSKPLHGACPMGFWPKRKRSHRGNASHSGVRMRQHVASMIGLAELRRMRSHSVDFSACFPVQLVQVGFPTWIEPSYRDAFWLHESQCRSGRLDGSFSRGTTPSPSLTA
jgi:hypothetical protein